MISISLSNQNIQNLINTESNREIFKHYLVKNYGKKQSIEILKNNKQDVFKEKGLAWALGKIDFEFFCRFYLQDLLFNGKDKAPLSPTHYKIWQEVESMILKKDYNNRNYLLPRGFGKTTCISVPLSIWCALYEYKEFIVIASAILDTATQFLKTIKNCLENNIYIEKSFGKLIDTKTCTVNEEKLELTNGVLIQSISASGAIRGKQNPRKNKRIELLILDDYQKSDECLTEQARDKKWKIFNADAKNAMQKDNSTILAVGTIQHKFCFYNRLANSNTWKTVRKEGVLLENPDEFFYTGHWQKFYKLLSNSKDNNRLDTAKEYYFQHEKEMQYPLLWQEYWSCLDYALNYYEDRALFFQEVQNNVDNIGEKKFKTIITQSKEEIESHEFKSTMLCCDPAGTRNKGNTSDYYAFIVGSNGENDIKYVRKGQVFKYEYEDYIEHVLELLKEYPDITHVYIEKNTYGGADVLELQKRVSEDNKLKHRNITWINEHQNKNKDDKINTVVSKVNLGQIIFNEEDTEAIQQLRDFAGCLYSLHDDFPDILAEFANRIDNIKTISKATVFDRSRLGL